MDNCWPIVLMLPNANGKHRLFDESNVINGVIVNRLQAASLAKLSLAIYFAVHSLRSNLELNRKYDCMLFVVGHVCGQKSSFWY